MIRAVQTYDPDSGIPFAAYALPRIHTAVSDALRAGASLVRVPRRRRARKSAGQADPAAPPEPKCCPLEHDPPDRHRARRGDQDPHVKTVGDRLRERHACALEVAARTMARRKCKRADRSVVVNILVEQRLRVAEPSARTALREIARATGSSYTRVLQCERRLYEVLRRALARDAEFERLVELSRRSEDGHGCAIDESLASELRLLSAEAFVRRVRAANRARQSEMIGELLQRCGEGAWNVVRRVFAELPQEAADELAMQVAAQE